MDDDTTSCIKLKPNLFWQSINILIIKPHVVNKRLWGCTILNRYYVQDNDISWENELKNWQLEIVNKKQFLDDILKNKQVKIVGECKTENEILLVELLPKSYLESHAFQIIYKNKSVTQVGFFDVTPAENEQNLCPTFSYSFSLQGDEVILKTFSDNVTKSHHWLQSTVLPQVLKWCHEISTKQVQICNESLALVPNEEYYTKYNELKLTYGKEMVKIWPECTDPTKFVYEDIAIATYLLLLWETDTKPQSFVDIGCGNGLLVYILSMEGHTGYGVDVRKRKIWDLYPNNINLKETTVTPSNMHIFSDVDWIIGNHSDELTPWIPVIAAQNSYKSNFFLLPCCAYNFDGTKYQRQNSSKSQYTEYLEYVKKVCDNCGFETEIDRLKIPSTKRICFIGRKRTYKENEHEKFVACIQYMISNQIGLSMNNETDQDIKTKEFKTRDPIERVRNCTQLDKNITDSIISCISNYLLDGCNLETNWSKGSSVAIHKLIKLLPSDKLKALKSECGGLQTLLRNNHHIFEVRNGCVNLRYPRTIDEVKNHARSKKYNDGLKMQIKPCWFYNNHPQGCPLDSSVCSFLHETST
nr:probable tRNA (uracil-O(2)-)-methyltransferase [Vanessa tameamea]